MLRLVNPPLATVAVRVPDEIATVPRELTLNKDPVIIFVDTVFVLRFLLIRFPPTSLPVDILVVRASVSSMRLPKVKALVESVLVFITLDEIDSVIKEPVEIKFVDRLFVSKLPMVNKPAEIVLVLSVLNAPDTVINVVVDMVLVLRISIVAVLAIIYWVDKFTIRSANDSVTSSPTVNVLTLISVV